MTLVSSSTAWEECKEALAAAIWSKSGVKIAGTDWTLLTPGGAPPKGLGSKANSWHATLDEAQAMLIAKGYDCSPIAANEIPPLLGKPLTKSTRLLFDHIALTRSVQRAQGIAA